LNKLFDVITSSAEFGVTKPDPKIYDILVEKLEVKPMSCLFIDDVEKNIISAEKVGMKTILFINQYEFEGELKKLEIKY